MADLTLRAGAYYKRFDGKIAGPIEPHAHNKFRWRDPVDGSTYTNEGIWYPDGISDPWDLISECTPDGKPIEEATAPEEDRWLPIETAPKDGTPVLLAGGTWVGEINGHQPNDGVLIASVKFGQWMVEGTDAYAAWVEEPLYWQPLPALPSSSQSIHNDR